MFVYILSFSKRKEKKELYINDPTAQLEKEMGGSMSYPSWAGIVRLILQLFHALFWKYMKKKSMLIAHSPGLIRSMHYHYKIDNFKNSHI